jgi:uncharacterized protein YbgA (DUF1722 family)/uncharacterized protein YbbK (DUF523 family)
MKPDDRGARSGEIRIGVSACLLGQKVRYDGGHKRNEFLVGTLGRFVSLVPVCPEVELGLGTPRPSLRLVALDGEVRLVESSKPSAREPSERDHAAAMRAWARQKLRSLAGMRLSGYVLKRNSPSCGMERVPLYRDTGRPTRKGKGLFAEALIKACPDLPVEEEGRLNDSRLRENFIERVFAYRDLNKLFEGRWRFRELVAFHSAHKFQLLAHSVEGYRRLERLVAKGSAMDRGELSRRYQHGFMCALRLPVTRARHVNVLQRMIGCFKSRLDSGSRRELQEVISGYRSGLVPLIVPVTLIRHYVSIFEVTCLKDQLYLTPRPGELMLRNHV